MAFSKVQYVDGETIITASNLNNIQDELIRLNSVKADDLDIYNAELIRVEDIDIICAEKVKVTFPEHGLSIRISYTDSRGVFHEKEDLPGIFKTTYEVIKDTVITVDGNYFDDSTFVLPEDNKYYTKISDYEIIPHMDFEIAYSDNAPA